MTEVYELNDLTLEIADVLSEQLSRYGISQPGTVERSIAAQIVTRALKQSPILS